MMTILLTGWAFGVYVGAYLCYMIFPETHA